MTAVRAVWIECDECGIDSNMNMGGAGGTVAAARLDARRAGWVRRRGRDLCDRCKAVAA